MGSKAKKNPQARMRRKGKGSCKKPTPISAMPMTRAMAVKIVSAHNGNPTRHTYAAVGWDGKRHVIHLTDPDMQHPPKTFSSPEAYEKEHTRIAILNYTYSQIEENNG